MTRLLDVLTPVEEVCPSECVDFTESEPTSMDRCLQEVLFE